MTTALCIRCGGRWVREAVDKIVKAVAPDGSAHICASLSESAARDQDDVFCIIMPPET